MVWKQVLPTPSRFEPNAKMKSFSGDAFFAGSLELPEGYGNAYPASTRKG
jgi:hypothetical protein